MISELSGYHEIEPVLDRDLALRYLEGDVLTWIELLDMFDIELRRVHSAVMRSVDSGDLTAARDALHNLKGLAPTLGASELAAIAIYLENRIQERNILRARDLQYLSDAVEAFALASARVRASKTG